MPEQRHGFRCSLVTARMPRWFARDRDGHLGVFDAEHMIPEVIGDVAEEDLDLTFELSRILRIENRPVRGIHPQVRGGTLQMRSLGSGGSHATDQRGEPSGRDYVR